MLCKISKTSIDIDIDFGEENHRVHVPEEEGISDKGRLRKVQVLDMAAQEIKTHYCRECNKVFRTGKALGGHLSVVHSRCNNSKKLETRQIKIDQSAEFKCPRCEKHFPSKKAMHGHMRMHSNSRAATRPTKAGTKSSAVNQFPDVGNFANLEAMVEDDHENFDYNVGKLVNLPEQRNLPGDYGTGRKIVSEDSMTSSAYYCMDCSLDNRWELEDDAVSKERESTNLTQESGLMGEKLTADSKSGGHETVMQSSPVDELEGTSCVEAKKLTGNKLNKRDSNLLEKRKTKRKKTDC